LCPSLKISRHLPAPIVNAGGDSHQKWTDFQLSRARVLDLGLGHTATIMHHLSTSTYMPNFIEIEGTLCGRTDGRTEV